MESKKLTDLPHAGRSPIQRFHATEPVRGLEDVPRSTLYEGRFGRMFRNLPPFVSEDEDLAALAATMIDPLPPKGEEEPKTGDNPNIPAGFTYFGQFIDHDLTFDPNSKLQRDNDPDALHNFRTPRFDLDSVYGNGPADNPFMYTDGVKFLIGKDDDGKDDLPRNCEERAVIGDPRNDENLIVSQLHLAFLKYHNKVVEAIRSHTPNDQLFDAARRIVRWHYQWVVVHDFLKRIVGDEVLNDILKKEEFLIGTQDGAAKAEISKADLKFYHYRNQPFIPIEFSVAAYRFGHSMVRAEYEINGIAQDIPIFSEHSDDLHGFRKRPSGLEIEWSRFFEFSESEGKPQPARKIDSHLSPGLGILPKKITGELPKTPIGRMLKSLAVRNLLRGKALGLPSGQAVARAMGIPDQFILNRTNLGLTSNLLVKFGDDTPLWFYILKEAEVFCAGEMLGPIGGRIVAEVFVGLLQADPLSYLRVEPNWRPERGKFGFDPSGKNFNMSDLLHFATTPELAAPSIVQPKKEAEMTVMFIGKYNGEFLKFDKEIHDATIAAALDLLGMTDGTETIPPKFDIPFKYVDSFRQIQPLGSDVQPTTRGFGWVAILSDIHFAKMSQALGYPDGPLCQMFNIEIISLNNDNASDNPTQDVYARMTPEFNWGHGGGS
jgi:hypothetical protein